MLLYPSKFLPVYCLFPSLLTNDICFCLCNYLRNEKKGIKPFFFSKISIRSLKTQSSHTDVKYSITKWVSTEKHIWHWILSLCHISGPETYLIHIICVLCPTFKETDVLACKQCIYRGPAYKVSLKMLSGIDFGGKRKSQLYCFKFFEKSAA